MGTIGGNVCLDTRCTYYNQNEEWRRSIDICLKEEGSV
jgi:4-hydroxybenzoyl-CoA reductase subunit beta